MYVCVVLILHERFVLHASHSLEINSPPGDVLLAAVAALVNRNAEELVLWAGDNGYT